MENEGPRPRPRRPSKKCCRVTKIASWPPSRLSGPQSAVGVANICFGAFGAILGAFWAVLGASWEPLGLYFWPPWGCSRPSWGRLGPIMVRPRNLCVCALSTFQEPPEEGWRQGRLRHHMRKNNNLHRKSLTLYNDTRRNPFHSAGMFRSQSQSEAPKKEDQPRYKPKPQPPSRRNSKAPPRTVQDTTPGPQRLISAE